MGDGTGIEWTNATWNPVRGCTRVSEGCRNCYAEQQAARIVRMGKGKPTPYDGIVRLVGGEPRWTGEVALDTAKLAEPLRWRKPRRVFVDSMSDLFHEKLTNEQIAAVFGVMAAAPQHKFQVLTKRAARMRAWFEWVASTGYDPGHVLTLALGDVAERDPRSDGRFTDDEWLVGLTNVINGRSSWAHHDDGNPLDGSRPRWPLPNVWIGVSVENQAAADERIPELLRTPAVVRFLSCEPLLGQLDLVGFLGTIDTCDGCTCGEPASAPADAGAHCDVCADAPATVKLRGPDWVIAGCESGPGARPADVAWYRSLRDQCAAAGVAFFLKQARFDFQHGVIHRVGEHYLDALDAGPGSHRKPGGVIGAPYLDGVQHLVFPEVTRG